MKQKGYIFIALVSCFTAIYISLLQTPEILRTGTIRFEHMNGEKEEFSIKVQTTLPPHTNIFFTDTEWNGSHLGIDEHTMIWNTGPKSINKGTLIFFERIATTTKATIGETKGFLKLSSTEEAIFAYQGTERMPIQFLAGIALDISDYGTLTNTGLIKDSTALIVP